VRIAFCTAFKNRLDHLRQTLPRNLAENPHSQFIVLNYNTDDGLMEWLGDRHRHEINSGRVVCYSHFDAPKYRMAHAKNMAHRAALLEGADILVNLDADNFARDHMDDFVEREFDNLDDIFLYSLMIKGKMNRGISGRIAVTKEAFLACGGYDESRFNGWGSDDKDINLRLRALGYDPVQIPPSYLDAITHNDKLRFREYPELSKETEDFFAVNPGTIVHGRANNGRTGVGTVFRNFDRTTPIRFEPLPVAANEPRVFGIGWHKTATTSLDGALEILGYNSWHWSQLDELRPAQAARMIWREMKHGRSETLERRQALSDFPIPLLFRELDEAYPGSKFILTVRNARDWLHAAARHFSTKFNPCRADWHLDPFTNKAHQIAYGRQDFEPDVFVDRYLRHNREVMDHFAGRDDQLLVMDMDKSPGWEKLCAFLGKPVPDEPYPFLNGSLT